MFLKIVINQARYKWAMTLLVFLAMVCLVALYVYLLNTSRFANRSMQLIMKNMGHNMLILPESANPLDTHLCTDKQELFPDKVTQNLADHTKLFSRYYVSVLQSRVDIGGVEALLTGIEPMKRKDESSEKGNMIKPVPPGKARAGAAVACGLGLEGGSKLTVLGMSFEVAQVLDARGTIDDFRVFVPLAECQNLLSAPGQINVVWAFECLHHGGPLEEIEAIQAQMLSEVQPGFRHISNMPIAIGRYMARQTTSDTLYYILGIVCVATVLIIAISGVNDVAERRREVGILASMGVGFPYIVSLYLAKLFTLAFSASVAGFVTGSLLAIRITSPFLVTNTRAVRIMWEDLPSIVFLTCAVTAVAMMLPMFQLLRLDPNATLVEE